MDPTTDTGGPDRGLSRGPCDICGHAHACYVGGRPTSDAAGRVVLWERQVCLGCIMRAARPGGLQGHPACELDAGLGIERRFGHA